MDEKKYVQKLLDISKNYNIDRLRNVNYSEDYHPFEGSPKRHPTNENILILITNPFEEIKHFFEFHLDTIGAVEEIGTMTSENNSAYLIRVWVKKGTIAVKSETFIVWSISRIKGFHPVYAVCDHSAGNILKNTTDLNHSVYLSVTIIYKNNHLRLRGILYFLSKWYVII